MVGMSDGINLGGNEFLTKSMISEGLGKGKPKKIKEIQFSMLDASEMAQLSDLRISRRELYHIGTRDPVPFGVLDFRLGVSDKKNSCQTCNQKLVDCTGHFGHIVLELPVFHIGFYKAILSVLQSICKSCSRVLLTEENRGKFYGSMTHPHHDSITKAGIRKKIVDTCKKMRKCIYCGDYNGTVKKVANAESLKLTHEKYKLKVFENDEEASTLRFDSFATVRAANPDLSEALLKSQEPLNPSVVLELFKAIPNEDLPFLWADEDHSRPEKMILTTMLVPPVAIRPSVKMDTAAGSNEDDLTMKLQEIIEVNNELGVVKRTGSKVRKMHELWNSLQLRVSQFFNGELPGLAPQIRRELAPIKGLVQRLKGKQGRFRGNLSGKRVDFSGRTVISPDPNLSIHQVGVPVHMAKVLTYPEVANRYNIDRLRAAIIIGPETHPGANLVRKKESNELKHLAYGNRADVASDLSIGDVVERHLMNDDIVLFNRQPSLHKMSIMSHRAKILEGRTLRFNECCCAPYNADFDGDEMNIHVPQTEESRAEAIELMGVQHNLITARNGEPLVCATQDFITASFLMTQRDVFFSREEFCHAVTLIGDGLEHIDIPKPAILKPQHLWTGKQIWNVLLRPNTMKNWPKVNIETKERNYEGTEEDGPPMCPNDGFVVFRNSELMCGNLGKGILGGSKSGLFYTLVRDYSEADASLVMNRMTKITTRWLSNFGFTIGIDDVTPDQNLLQRKSESINGGYSKAERIIQQFKQGTLSARPGCNLEESLESEISGILSNVRDESGKICMTTLPKHNKPLVMATCGSKGSALNICQMMVCVGQQIVGGKRMPYGFVRRTLPHFRVDAKDPVSKGFVANSFYSGLTAPEFFFHTMGGREGLVDTAVKTAETGYMARRLMKALEDLSVRYDGSVRNSSDGIVQFTYGDDGLNPAFMEKGDRPVNWDRLSQHTRSSNPFANEKALTPYGIRHMIKKKYSTWKATLVETGYQHTFGASKELHKNAGLEFFHQELYGALSKTATQLEEQCRSIGLRLDSNAYHFELSSDEEVQNHRKKVGHGFDNVMKWAAEASDKTCAEYRNSLLLCMNHLQRVTSSQVELFVKDAVYKFMRAMTEPGEAVGAIGAQSLGEPGTQMTLKTFHFAGVASMNVTLGVPRIKEIINASKNISTPIMTVAVEQNKSESVVRMIQNRLEKTTLGQICSWMETHVRPDGCHIVMQLASDIARLHLECTVDTVRTAILNHKPLKMSKNSGSVTTNAISHQVIVMVPPQHSLGFARKSPGETSMKCKLPDELQQSIPMYFNMEAMLSLLQGVIVQGIPTVHRAVVNRDDGDETSFHLLVEGSGLQDVIGIAGVNGKNTRTNHITEMEEVLGIEAARLLIMQEVAYIFGQYGLGIDKRHLMLLADVMSYRGQILGITRFGIAKMKESVLMLASFEKTADHLFDAAVHARKDNIDGVSECIIMGTPVPLGTGMFKLLSEWECQNSLKNPPRAPTIFG